LALAKATIHDGIHRLEVDLLPLFKAAIVVNPIYDLCIDRIYTATRDL
jgi:hypothetical protein